MQRGRDAGGDKTEDREPSRGEKVEKGLERKRSLVTFLLFSFFFSRRTMEIGLCPPTPPPHPPPLLARGLTKYYDSPE